MARNFESSERQASGERAANPAVIPILIALILIAGAIALALLAKKPKNDVDASPPPLKPFAEMPPEAKLPPRGKEDKPSLPDAPESVASDPAWVEAQALAAEAKVLYDEAVKAKAQGDLALSYQSCDAAHFKYKSAIEASAEWEENLLSKYNENDSKIRAIKETRTDWLNKLLWLEKGLGH